MIKRIDKIISEQTNYSRKEIKKLISKGLILVNDVIVKKSEEKFEEENIKIKIANEELEIREHIYLVLNKPKGYISATEDNSQKTVLDLVPEKYKTRVLFPAGRLDKDTTGLMIITDDGEFAHDILSPRKHVKKVYEVLIDIPVTEEMIEGFSEGVKLNDASCKPAYLEKTGEYTALVTLKEGRYHQIKRMFGCYKAKVLELNRVCIGNYYLPKELKEGEVIEIFDSELDHIKEKI